MIFVNNDKYLVTGSTDGLVKIFDAETYILLETIKAGEKDITMLLHSQQSDLLFFTDSQKIFIFDLKEF